jgi:cytoskeletal protein RodZ
MTNLEYDGQVLANTRREQKLKVDDIATELCLSVQQVEAIENNLGSLFHSNELKQAVIKRYCRLVNVDANSVITKFEEDCDNNTFREINKNNLSKSLKKYFYLSIAALISAVVWRIIA